MPKRKKCPPGKKKCAGDGCESEARKGFLFCIVCCDIERDKMAKSDFLGRDGRHGEFRYGCPEGEIVPY